MNTLKKLIVYLVFSVLGALVLFLLLEGVSSALFVLADLLAAKPPAERRHTQYDPDLGWVNLPNLFIQNMYGPGISVQTNSQGFRNAQDIQQTLPENTVRLICSGDSFTFGYGVDNNHTWVHLLTALNPHIQTVNMGQGGYGIDQAYLWYLRDGQGLEHSIHIFAFVTDDFRRMQNNDFMGYQKPVLTIQDERITPQNIPVPRPSALKRWVAQYGESLKGLKSLSLLNLLFTTDSDSQTPPAESSGIQIEPLVIGVFNELQRINRTQNSTLVLVYLPSATDYYIENSQETVRWQKILQTEAARYGWNFIDLIEDYRQLTYRQAVDLFILPGAVDYPYAAWHYNETGNAYIAMRLYEMMLAIPEVAEKLL